jgi:methanogenic corrinoid protein MtbC1
MVKGYQPDEIKQKLVEVLRESKTGLSGIEISQKLGVNRVTMSKYLNVFAAEGLIRQKNIGNVNLWFVEEGTEPFQFPDDYFKVKTKYIELLQEGSTQKAHSLIRNCVYSNAQTAKIMTEIIIPAFETINELYQKGKISKSEQKLIERTISNSIQILNLTSVNSDPQKNVIIISADSANHILAEAASASFHSDGWSVSHLGDMSDSIDVLFDLDLQKFLAKVWKQKNGIMIIVVFSDSEEGLKFFSQAIISVKGKMGKNLFLVLCSKNQKTTVKADLVTDNFGDVLQWSQTISERLIS